MRMGDYFRERTVRYLTFIAALVASAWILLLFETPREVVLIVSAILLLVNISAETAEYMRHKAFYNALQSNLDQLDRKYLLSEMTGEPEFCEGRILYQILCETCKSMNDQVAAYRRESADFCEFIELWVHEIKLPVASLQLMCHKDGNSKYMNQVRRIDDYIENVLYYVRGNNAEKDYLIQIIPLKRAVRDVALRYREELQACNISLVTENLDVCVMTDSKWLVYILSQLMANSIKYIDSERESVIEIRAEEQQDRTVLHFRDNGIGIPKTDLPRIFEKSFTGENGRIGAKSTGMGLYLVGKLCEKLGHGVRAESVQGEYTEIQLLFGKDRFHGDVVSMGDA